MNLKQYSILFLLMLYLLSSCIDKKMSVDKNTKAEIISDSSDNKYKVFKIDSIEGIYMIYALKSGKYHKIISQNSDSINSNWKPILPNVIYEFKLDTLISQIGVYEHMYGLVWTDDGPTIDFEGDSIRVLYTSPNIKGLYYNPKIE